MAIVFNAYMKEWLLVADPKSIFTAVGLVRLYAPDDSFNEPKLNFHL